MKKFDRENSFDELLETMKSIDSKSKFSEMLKQYESVKDFLESIYNKGYDAGKKSKVETLKKLN